MDDRDFILTCSNCNEELTHLDYVEPRSEYGTCDIYACRDREGNIRIETDNYEYSDSNNNGDTEWTCPNCSIGIHPYTGTNGNVLWKEVEKAKVEEVTPETKKNEEDSALEDTGEHIQMKDRLGNEIKPRNNYSFMYDIPSSVRHVVDTCIYCEGCGKVFLSDADKLQSELCPECGTMTNLSFRS